MKQDVIRDWLTLMPDDMTTEELCASFLTMCFAQGFGDRLPDILLTALGVWMEHKKVPEIGMVVHESGSGWTDDLSGWEILVEQKTLH